MKQNFSRGSLTLFGLSVLFWVLLTLFESALVGLSLPTERAITFLLLVAPAAAGVILGGISLVRKEGPLWRAVAGITLNGLFALFHTLLLLFAG